MLSPATTLDCAMLTEMDVATLRDLMLVDTAAETAAAFRRTLMELVLVLIVPLRVASAAT